MDTTFLFLYIASMGYENYFGGLRFLAWGHIPDYAPWVETYQQHYWALQFNYKGVLRFGSGDARLQEVEGPHAVVAGPGYHFRYGAPPGQTRDHRFVCFAGPRIKGYAKSGLVPAGPRVPLYPIQRPQKFAADMDRLFDLLGPDLNYFSFTPRNEQDMFRHHAPAYNLAAAVHTLEGLLLQLHQQPIELAAGPLTEPLKRFIRRIRLDPGRPYDFNQEARIMGVSLAHFRRIFPKCAGMAPERFVRHCRMEQAANLLLGGNAPIADVAGRVGIPDVYHFTKLFKGHFHIPPARFRRELAATQPLT